MKQTDWNWLKLIPWGPAVQLLWNCCFWLKICQESHSNLEPRRKRIQWPRYWVEKWITHLFSSLSGHFYLWLLPWGLPDIPELCSAHTLGLGNSIWDESGEKRVEIKVFLQDYQDFCTIISCQMELLPGPWWVQEASGVDIRLNAWAVQAAAGRC